MEKIRFSIIVPVYNVEKYLEECMYSILSQTFSLFEVILVDDGSTDRSAFLCDTYATRFPEKVSVIHKKNEGLISARRIGLKQAKGEYICFVDPDDYIRKDMLERVNIVIKEWNSDIVLFDLAQVDGEGNLIGKKVERTFEEGIIEKEIFFKEVLMLTFNSLCTKICKQDLFDVDTDYSSLYDLQRGEDLLQSLPLIGAAEKIYYIKENFYYYRQNVESITHKYQNNQYRILGDVFPLLYDYMINLGYDSNENILLFYRNYLQNIWESLVIYLRSDAKLQEYKSTFEEIFDYKHVKLAKEYIKKIKLFRHKVAGEFGLKLFYKRYWSILICYLRILIISSDLKNKVWRNWVQSY